MPKYGVVGKLLLSAMTIGLLFASLTSVANATTISSGDVCTGSGCAVNMPKAEITTNTLSGALKILFAVAGVISVLFVAIGGFKYTTSAGDSNGIQSAKNTILYAVVGLAISTSAFIIVQLVIGRV